MEWIRIKDKLPELGERILIYGKDNNGEMRVLYGFRVYGYWVVAESWGTYSCSDVTHWAKMPEGPKKQ